MRTPTEIEIFESEMEASRAGAESFVACATEAIKRHGRFDVALSGGETPIPMYRMLARAPLRDRVPWKQVHLFWGDERAVPPEHPRSNFGSALEAFVSAVPIPESQVHRMRGELDAEEAAGLYQQELESHFGDKIPVFDLIHLGVGDDGHTASLFPDGPELRVGDRSVVASVDTQHEEPRVTLTFPVINAARRVEILVLEGAKAELVAELIRGDASARDYPAASIAPDGHLVWMLGRAAAGDLSSGEAKNPAKGA